MRIFDDSEHNRDGREPTSGLSIFEFVNGDWELIDNSATRDHCQSWFQRIPENSHKKDLRESFRSESDSQHDGAFFELFLHELFARLGCDVEFQPEVQTKTPDFRLSEGEISVIVEATVAGRNSNPLKPGPNEQKVLDDLNTLKSPDFSLLYDVSGKLTRTPPKSYVVRKVQALLDENNPRDVQAAIDRLGRKAAPYTEIECNGWLMTVWLWPRDGVHSTESMSESIVIGRMHAQWIDPISSVKEALEKKRRDYKRLQVPLVLAVNAANPYFSSKGHELDVLWGIQDIQYGKGDSEEVNYVRRTKGFWQSSSSERIAGVLFVRNADILNMFQASASLHVNPHYRVQALPSALLRLPHYTEFDGRPVGKDGENVAHLLGVNWR